MTRIRVGPQADRQGSMSNLRFKPLTAARWRDLERLFGKRGACGGCWCMLWRLRRSQFDRQKGARNKRALKALVDAGSSPGLLAYDRGEPIGWCSVAPRESFPALERSRILKPVDDRPVWSITCFFVARPHRRRGVSVGLLRAAADHVARQGGRIVEGYPVEPRTGATPDVFAWTGLSAAFRAAGFKECLRRSATRPIMRREVAIAP
jgi:GNAT superfamily N-acetyltransferase